jgi:hypothetical protein
MHQKYEKYLSDVAADSKAMQADLGPAPDPDGKYWWQRRGGTDALMKPDGLLREPYDQKYALYHQNAKLTADWEQLKDDDGVTSYSREWWKAAASPGPNTATFKQAYHETLAEMARLHYETGVIPGTKRWRDIYKAVEKNWGRGK